MDFTELTIAMLPPEQVRNIRLRLEDLELAFETIADETPARRAAAKRRGWKTVDAADHFEPEVRERQAALEATLDEEVAARFVPLKDELAVWYGLAGSNHPDADKWGADEVDRT